VSRDSDWSPSFAQRHLHLGTATVQLVDRQAGQRSASRYDRAVRFAALLVAVVAAALSVQGSVTAGPRELRRLDVLVVAGQSNALGYESYVVDPQTGVDIFTSGPRSQADRRVLFMWHESGVRMPSTSPVPLDTIQRRIGAERGIFGPEIGLARSLYAAGHHQLLIVKVAVGGSSLAKGWLPAHADYRLLINEVHAGVSWAWRHGWRPTVSALYWFQGETDATKAADSSAYAANLTSFLAAIRIDLGLGKARPIVVTQTDVSDYIAYELAHRLCTSPNCESERAWNGAVMAAQAAAAGTSTYVVPTSALPRVHNYVHLSNQAELTLGQTFAQETTALLP